jgi:UDP-glucose 4,6-dehydratase
MEYTPNNILITGGCGFIGSHLVNKMVSKYPQYKIVNFDKLDICSSVKNCEISEKKSNYKFIKGDICSVDLINYVLKTERIDTIIHVAAQSHVDTSFGNSISFTKNNVLGTHVLLEAAYKVNIKKFIHISTDEVYGNCIGEQKTENSSTNPTNPYSASKAAAESIVQSYINSYNFPAIITRGNNVYGPCQYVEKLIGKMVLRLRNNTECCIHGNGTNRRHFLHVNDTVNAFDLILHKGTNGEIYNIGSSDEFQNIDIVKKIIKRVKPNDDFKNWIIYVKDRAFNDVRYFLCYEKLLSLGWNSEVNFENGLNETIDWYLNVDIEDYWSKDATIALEPHPHYLDGYH